MAHVANSPPGTPPAIHHTSVNDAQIRRSPAQTDSVSQHPPLTQQQLARRGSGDRANFYATHKLSGNTSKQNPSPPQDPKNDFESTKNSVTALAYSNKPNFAQKIQSLFNDNSNIEVDFSSLSEGQTRIVLDALKERVKGDDSNTLHHLRFSVDIDHSSPELMREMDETITAIRGTTAGKNTAVQFACKSQDANRTDASELSGLTNITSVTFSGCKSLITGPDLSNKPALSSFNFSDCEKMTNMPDIRNTPSLMAGSFKNCGLKTSPNFSNTSMKAINFAKCNDLETGPHFTNAPSLEAVGFLMCDKLETPPSFSNTPKLKAVVFARCPNLPAGPDFSNTPSLMAVSFIMCDILETMSNFSNNPNLQSVTITRCPRLPAATIASLSELLGDRLKHS